MMTLALLLTAVTGAWAESKPIGLNVEYEAGDEITSTTDVYVYYGEQPSTSKKMGVKITSTQPLKIYMITAHSFELNGDAAVYYLPDGEATNGYAGGIPCIGESTGDETVVHVASGSGTLTDPYVFGFGPSGTPVPLTRGTGEKINEWTLTNGMPAGNVTVRVKYFAQAEFAKSTDETLAPAAIDGVPANTDAPIVTAGTVANIGESEVPQGTLMFFVIQPTDNTAPVAPTYDTEGWTDKVPTANELKQGDVYVWYYIKGAEPAQGTDRSDDNTRSDSDIKPLGTDGIVTLAAEPTYDVSLNKTGMAEGEPALWKAKSTNVAEVNLGEADLGGVKKSETVTVTYTGTKKIIGVKAAKKAKAKPLANATTEDLGKVVGADGNIYANKADAEAVATGNAVAMICYVNEGHGLALALSDISSYGNSWDNSSTNNGGKTAAELCSAWNTSKAVTGATWKLASKSEMSLMINAAGNYAALRDGFSAVGGTNMIDEYYWLSDESSADYAENINFSYGSWSQEFKNVSYKVRACLAF